MYGFDGDMDTLQWATVVGFDKLATKEQADLIASGHFTTEGHQIFLPGETIPADLSNANIRSRLDIRM